MYFIGFCSALSRSQLCLSIFSCLCRYVVRLGMTVFKLCFKIESGILCWTYFHGALTIHMSTFNYLFNCCAYFNSFYLSNLVLFLCNLYTFSLQIYVVNNFFRHMTCIFIFQALPCAQQMFLILLSIFICLWLLFFSLRKICLRTIFSYVYLHWDNFLLCFFLEFLQIHFILRSMIQFKLILCKVWWCINISFYHIVFNTSSKIYKIYYPFLTEMCQYLSKNSLIM